MAFTRLRRQKKRRWPEHIRTAVGAAAGRDPAGRPEDGRAKIFVETNLALA